MGGMPPGTQEILAMMDSSPRGRAELLGETGIDISHWSRIINYLMDFKLVERLGSKRGTRYIRCRTEIGTDHVHESFVETARDHSHVPAPAECYHDIVEEALAELSVAVD